MAPAEQIPPEPNRADVRPDDRADEHRVDERVDERQPEGPDRAVRAVAARLRDLCEKYALLDLLCRGEPGRTIERRDALRRVASRFPAALREWEEVGPEELRRRGVRAGELLERLQTGGRARLDEVIGSLAAEPALRFGADLHGYLRELLLLRRFLTAHARATGAQGLEALRIDEGVVAACAAFCAGLGPLAHCRLSTELLQEVARPAGGRLSALAYAQVAARHGVAVATVKAALFG